MYYRMLSYIISYVLQHTVVWAGLQEQAQHLLASALSLAGPHRASEGLGGKIYGVYFFPFSLERSCRKLCLINSKLSASLKERYTECIISYHIISYHIIV